MRGFVMLGNVDLMKSKAFYDELLSIVGLNSLCNMINVLDIARSKGDPIEFYITPQNGEDATFGNGTQVSFLLTITNRLKNFATALKLGATNEGDPDLDILENFMHTRDHNNKLCISLNDE